MIPYQFLTRLSYDAHYVKSFAGKSKGSFVELSEFHQLQSFTDSEGSGNFADFRLGWNETGLLISCRVKGKKAPPVGDVKRPRESDGLGLWLDTRGDRTSHRANRTCMQFFFLPNGTGTDNQEGAIVPQKINRALMDAPLPNPEDIPFEVEIFKGGYFLQAYLSADILSGFDPEQYPVWGIFFAINDMELGLQTPSIGLEFPFCEDPSLWATLRLQKPEAN